MAKCKDVIFLDRKNVKISDEILTILTPGVIDRQGVFETLRVYDGQVFALEEHLQRLARGWKLLALPGQCDAQHIQRQIKKVLGLAGRGNQRLRLSYWMDGECLREGIACLALPTHIQQKQTQGLTAFVSSIKRNKTKTSHIKSLAYRLMRQALLEAQEQGCQEALLLNSKSEVVEGACSNVFIVKKGVLLTPPVSSGCLNGITRQFVCVCAKNMGLRVEVASFTLNDLEKAQEVFCTNSLMEIASLLMINGKKIADGVCGVMTAKLQLEYKNMVNKGLEHKLI